MFDINFLAVEEVEKALTEYSGNIEDAINEVFHSEEVNSLAQKAIKALMPQSHKNWRGKKPAAKTSNSLRKLDGNLSVTIRTQKPYQYLYFADDGTNTRRHIGNQQFFARGGENVKGDIIERCKDKLVNNFEKGA